MNVMSSQITGISIVCWTVCSGAVQRKHQTPRRWPLWGESTGDRWVPLTKGQRRGNCFHLMTSSRRASNAERISTARLPKYLTFLRRRFQEQSLQWEPLHFDKNYTMMTSFSALLALCAGNSPVTGELPAQRPVTRSFDVFFDLCLNKRLSK